MFDSLAYARIDVAAHEAATGHNRRPLPTEAQQRVGNYKKGRARLHGMGLVIENPRGTYRCGMSADGVAWSNRMAAHYGYFAGTRGADGDPVDVFVGHFPESTAAWVINQRRPDGAFDEHKVMLGFHTEDQARAAYTDSYSPDWQGLKSIVPIRLDQLREWLRVGPRGELAVDQFSNQSFIMDRVQGAGTGAVVAFSPSRGMYALRAADVDDGLLLDAVTMAELMGAPEWEGEASRVVLDALVVEVGRLQPKMDALLRVMQLAGQVVKPMSVSLSEPVRARGVLNVMALFMMDDGQTVSLWLHNPDTTPSRLAPMDELISWKWMLNKRDVTIVVAPERGVELDAREVAKRLMRLVEKNSAAFKKANEKAAERAEQMRAIDAEILQLTGELTELQHKIEVARVAFLDKPKPALAPIEPGTPEFVAWEDAVTAAVEAGLEVTRSDAQAFVEMKTAELREAFEAGVSVDGAAKMVMGPNEEDSPESSTSGNPGDVTDAQMAVLIATKGYKPVARFTAATRETRTHRFSGVDDGISRQTWDEAVAQLNSAGVYLRRSALTESGRMLVDSFHPEIVGSDRKLQTFSGRFAERASITEGPADISYRAVDELFTAFYPNTSAGEDAWRVIAEQSDGTGKVLSTHAADVIRQLRDKGYAVSEAIAGTSGAADEALLAELSSNQSGPAAQAPAEAGPGEPTSPTDEQIEAEALAGHEVNSIAYNLTVPASERAGLPKASLGRLFLYTEDDVRRAAKAVEDAETQRDFKPFDASKLKMPSAAQLGATKDDVATVLTRDEGLALAAGWSNGFLLDLKQMPKFIETAMKKRFGDLLNPGARVRRYDKADIHQRLVSKALANATTPAEPIALWDGAVTEVKNSKSVTTARPCVVLVDRSRSGAHAAIQLPFFAYFLKTYPGCEFYIGASSDMVLVRHRGEVVGVAMPYNFSERGNVFARAVKAAAATETPDPASAVDAAYRFASATPEFKRVVAETIDKDAYSAFLTARDMDREATKRELFIAWDVASDSVFDTVGLFAFADSDAAPGQSRAAGPSDGTLLDAVAAVGGDLVGTIYRGGDVVGRAEISSGDGKAMVFLGESGDERVSYRSEVDGTVRHALWSDDDATLMIGWLDDLLNEPKSLAPAEQPAEQPVEPSAAQGTDESSQQAAEPEQQAVEPPPAVEDAAPVPPPEDPAGTGDSKDMTTTPTATPAEAPAKDDEMEQDRAYLQSFVDGTADVLSDDILPRMEPLVGKYEGHAEMGPLLAQAMEAYSAQVMQMAQQAIQ